MKIMIAIPCLAKIDTAFVQSLISLDKTGLDVAVQSEAAQCQDG